MLKKVILCSLLFFYSFYIAKANLANMFYLDEPIANVYTLMDKVDKKAANYVKVIRRKSDNQFVYCVRPGFAIDSNGVYSSYDNNQWNHLNISKEKWEKINLISYFGYQFENHQDLEWYAVTQYLIWLEVLPDGWDVYFTDGLRGPKTNRFDNKINEIKKLVETYYLEPSIIKDIELNYKENTSYIDNNNVLNNYEVEGTKEVTINNNTLTIKKPQNNFSFILKWKTNGNLATLYKFDNAQSVITRGSAPNKEISYNVFVNKGKIKLNKKADDKVFMDFQGTEATLNGAKYVIYNDTFYQEYLTTSEGSFITDYLPFGSYFIKELVPSTGYEIDNTIYKVELYENKIYEVVVYEKPIVSNIIISKHYDDLMNLKPEEGAVWGIFDMKNNLLVEKITDKSGKIIFNVPYGKYKLKQLKGIRGYYLHEDKILIVNNSQEIYKEVINKPILKEVVIKKVDENSQLITDNNFEFKILDTNKKKYLSFENEEIFSFNEEGNLLLPFKLGYGNYLIEELSNNNNYYKTGAKLAFTIDDSTPEKLELTLKNKFKKYNIKVIKKIEVWQKDLIKLEPGINISFCLYAKEDVIQNKEILYLKNDLVECRKTNEDGYILFEELSYGKYFLKEDFSDDNYLDVIPIDVDLNNKNVYTVINYLKKLPINDNQLINNPKTYDGLWDYIIILILAVIRAIKIFFFEKRRFF